MPDYGLRPPPYFSGELPLGILGHTPYGWAKGISASNVLDMPFNRNNALPGDFVYERLDWNKFKGQLYGKNGPGGDPSSTGGHYSNPPFMGAGQMTGPNGAPEWMRGPDGGVQRILRGYLRRQHLVGTEPESFVRLYFMYNPDQVNRQYLSWSDDTTADMTGNLGVDSSSAPAGVPSMTTMSFTLYFDRQIEVLTVEDHPGVMVDLQTFDVLSGNMVYSTPAGTTVEVPVLPPGMAIPDFTDATDNRTGQYQPMVSNVATTVTAVFSPSLAVEGVLSGASATFTKFSKRMTPTTMALNITLMVLYVGKNNNQSVNSDLGTGISTNPSSFNPNVAGFVPPTTQEARNNKTISGASAAVDFAEQNLMDKGSTGWYSYSLRNQGPPCNKTEPTYTDAAALVWRSFYAVGWTGTDQKGGDLLGLGSSCGAEAPTAGDFALRVESSTVGQNRRWQIFSGWQDDGMRRDDREEQKAHEPLRGVLKELRKGDILIGKPGKQGSSGTVVFFYGISGDLDSNFFYQEKNVTILHSSGKDIKESGGVGAHQQGGVLEQITPQDIDKRYDIIARPEPWGPTTDTAATRAGGGGATGEAVPGAEAGVLTFAQTVEAATGLAIAGQSPDPIRLSPAALDKWNDWRRRWGGPIPCTSGWRDAVTQEASYKSDPHRFAPAAKSYHCKGLAVDVDQPWLNALSASEQSRLRIAAREAGWGQARWRVKGQGQNAPYEASCNSEKSTDTFENWHFSVNGCG